LDSAYVILEGEEHHHLSRVSRIKTKDKVWLFDERGKSYLAQVEQIKRTKTKLLILEERKGEEAKVKITLAQALLKSKKMEFIIQKSAEMGITNVIPVIAFRSVARIEEKIERKLERWQKIAREAVKQSKSSWVPHVSPPLPLKELIKEDTAEKKLFLTEKKGKYLKDILLQYEKSQSKDLPSSVLILAGAEGGWTREEEELVLDNGFEAVSLGENILRAETAAFCALALISHFWNS
jgi:16S rRNA (uracil1498-N3)-methyltransferase